MEKWCQFLLPLYSVKFLYLSEESNSHQKVPSAPLEEAKFTEIHKGLLKHSNVQSKTSKAVNVPTVGTAREWNSSLTN